MEHDTLHSTPAGNPGASRMKVSLRHGIECWFDVDDITIRVWGAPWSGREVISVQDAAGERVVSQKRNLRFNSPHEFEYGGHLYRVEIRLKFGVAEIRLFRDGELIDSDLHDGGVRINLETGRMNWSATLKKILPALVLGGLVGAAFGYLVGSLFK
ncbi:hypothetical protein [Wenzhouxiangella sp. XN24]|uniref:hypothetical protein n=1 Tax=Wenzhouxiangella sp. XN24 TaxID=2713569 RepID=UPI0013E9B701|nr:hypothetical protein [Wenzhouxiangella sp. XN24]NGX16299.1 hypothetical protein [Wenzhouxiangella sp. XN24]